MTAALIIASGKTDGKEFLKPDKKIGTITAIERIVLSFQHSGIQRIVIVSSGADDFVKKLVPSMNLTFLECADGPEMFDRIKTGLAYLEDKCTRALITYVDIPMFSADTVRALLDAHADLCIPSYRDRCGHPVLLQAAHFARVRSYTGGQGLKGATKALGLSIQIVEVADAGILSDIQKDTEYEKLLPDHDLAKLHASFRFRIYKERTFYGPGPHHLLCLTRETGSLSEACPYMGISYSKGRKIIAAIESQMGVRVIETQQGGRGGGFSHLTREAKELMRCYDAFCTDAKQVFQELFEKHFSHPMKPDA